MDYHPIFKTLTQTIAKWWHNYHEPQRRRQHAWKTINSVKQELTILTKTAQNRKLKIRKYQPK